MRPIGDGRTRITVRHVAAAPEVDIRIRRSHEKWAVAIEDFANGQEATTHLRPGAARFDALVANTTTRTIGPADLTLKAKRHYFVYAWGSADSGYDFLLQTRRLATK